jgi:hypothetical protein
MACFEITPDDFDDMHHALGRPDLATLLEGENYRNFFATEAGSTWSVHAETLGMWDRITREGVGIVTYRVNADGKSALADWLRLREMDAGRPDAVTSSPNERSPRTPPNPTITPQPKDGQ